VDVALAGQSEKIGAPPPGASFRRWQSEFAALVRPSDGNFFFVFVGESSKDAANPGFGASARLKLTASAIGKKVG